MKDGQVIERRLGGTASSRAVKVNMYYMIGKSQTKQVFYIY